MRTDREKPGKKVLVVEPDKILAVQTKSYLSSLGHEVRVEHDAQAAIIAVDENAPDIVVTEVLLARHSGVEFIYEFRSYSEWQSIPIVILSRVEQSELGFSRKTIRDLNIGAILYKPHVGLRRLGDAIESLLMTSQESA